MIRVDETSSFWSDDNLSVSSPSTLGGSWFFSMLEKDKLSHITNCSHFHYRYAHVKLTASLEGVLLLTNYKTMATSSPRSIIDSTEKIQTFFKIYEDYNRASKKTRGTKLKALLIYVYEAYDEELLRAIVEKEMVEGVVELTISSIIELSKSNKSIGR